LEVALAGGHTHLAEHILGKGADVGVHSAVWMGEIERVSRLIERGADLNIPDRENRLPLLLAVWARHADIVELLITHGARVDGRTFWGTTALREPAGLGYQDIAAALVAHGADPNPRIDPNVYDDHTPLQEAASCGRLQTVEWLLSKGADARVRTRNGKTALDVARQGGFADVVRVLGGDPNDPAVAATGSRRVIVRDPNAVIRFLLACGIEFDEAWVPEDKDLEGLDDILDSYLRGKLASDASWLDRVRVILPGLRRYRCECSGFVLDGTKYVICHMHLVEGPSDQPPDNDSSPDSSSWYGTLRIVFELGSKTVMDSGRNV
jgi:hypothetical protein